jgi:hypothetical protein
VHDRVARRIQRDVGDLERRIDAVPPDPLATDSIDFGQVVAQELARGAVIQSGRVQSLQRACPSGVGAIDRSENVGSDAIRQVGKDRI